MQMADWKHVFNPAGNLSYVERDVHIGDHLYTHQKIIK